MDVHPVDTRRPRRPAPGGRIAVVDGLRLIAALAVVAYHLIAFGKGWTTPAAELFPVAHVPASYGWLGVELFFLISGFVICMSCWGRSVGDFFVSRVARLYPAYIFAVIATTAVLFIIPGGRWPHSVEKVLINLTMLQQPLGSPPVDPVYWTLWAELRFYLLFAIVVWRGLTYRRAIAFCFVWAAAAVVASAGGNPLMKQLLMPQYCWYFIAGIAFFLMYRFRPTLLLTGIVVGCFLAAQRFALRTHAGVEKKLGELPDLPVIALIALFFIIMALVATGRLSWIRGRWLTVAGAMTYPLYLLHEYIGWEIIGLLEPYVPAPLLLTALIAALLLASWLVHRLVERPAGRWLRTRLRAGLTEARTAVTSESDRDRAAGDRKPPAGETRRQANAESPVSFSPITN